MAAAPHGTNVDHAADVAHGAADAAAHGGEHAAVFPPFDPSTFASQLVWFVITFGALYFVVSRVVLPAVGGVLAKRAAKLREDHDAAASDSAQAETAREAGEAAIARARADARVLVEDKRAAIVAELTDSQAEAEAALVTRAAAAEARIADARAKALGEMDAVANDLAAAIVAKLVPGAGARSAAAATARAPRIVEREGEER